MAGSKGPLKNGARATIIASNVYRVLKKVEEIGFIPFADDHYIESAECQLAC